MQEAGAAEHLLFMFRSEAPPAAHVPTAGVINGSAG